ncbi:hypothetical protein LINPERHAP1_LOCUS21406 [Linum perenne]
MPWIQLSVASTFSSSSSNLARISVKQPSRALAGIFESKSNPYNNS